MIAEAAQWKAAFLAVWFALFFVWERLNVATPPPGSRMRLATNFGMWGIVFVMSPLIILPIAAWADGAVLWTRPPWMRGWAGLLLDLLVLDLWIYWLHRAYHEVPLMWRLHAVHHLDEHLDTTSALRFHAGEVVLSAGVRIAPIFVFAIPFVHVVVFEALVLAAAIFHHSNIKLPARFERILSWFVVTPSIHWVHHHAVRADTDSNYATVLSVWDRLFASRSATARTPEMKIGVEGIEEQSILRLILLPVLNNGRPKRNNR